MRLFNFKPSRAARSKDTDVFFDLDRLISSPVPFKFKGKIHEIKPIDQETFLRVANELGSLDILRRKQAHDPIEIRHAYHRLFANAVDTLTEQDCISMTDAQLGALCQQIIDSVTGKAQVEIDQKKSLENQSTR